MNRLLLIFFILLTTSCSNNNSPKIDNGKISLYNNTPSNFKGITKSFSPLTLKEKDLSGEFVNFVNKESKEAIDNKLIYNVQDLNLQNNNKFQEEKIDNCPMYVAPNTYFNVGRQKSSSDSRGRIQSAFIVLPPFGSISTRVKCQTTVGNYAGARIRNIGYDGGHLIGDNLGGYNGRENFAPQWYNINQGIWSKLEKALTTCPVNHLYYLVRLNYDVEMLDVNGIPNPLIPYTWSAYVLAIEDNSMHEFTWTFGNSQRDEQATRAYVDALNFLRNHMGCAVGIPMTSSSSHNLSAPDTLSINGTVGSNATGVFDIQNLGDAEISYNIQSQDLIANIEGPQRVYMASLAHNQDVIDTNLTSGTLAGGASQSISVSKACTVPGKSGPFPVVISGEGADSKTVNVTAECVLLKPIISVPSSLQISADVGSVAQGSFNIANRGSPVSLLTYALSKSSLDLGRTTGIIVGGQGQDISVRKTCATVNDSGTYPVIVSGVGVESKTVNVTVNCVAPKPILAVPSSLQISADVGSVAQGSFSIANNGSPASQLVYGLSASSLELSRTTGSIIGGQSQDISVQKTCTTANDSGTYPILISGEAIESKTVNVDVICKEKPPKLEGPFPASVDFGTMHVGDTVSKTMTVTNTGGGIVHLSLPDFPISGDWDIHIANLTKNELKAGESATITLQATCKYPYWYGNPDIRTFKSTYGIRNDITGVLELPFQARCIPDDSDVGGVLSYSVSAAAGMCDYGQYNGDIDTPNLPQYCGSSPEAAKAWAEAQLPKVKEYWDNQCKAALCNYEITDYQSPGSGFGDSRSRHVILHYK